MEDVGKQSLVWAFDELNAGIESQFEGSGVECGASDEFGPDTDGAAEGSECVAEVITSGDDHGFGECGQLQQVLWSVDSKSDEGERKQGATDADGNDGVSGAEYCVCLPRSAVHADPAGGKETGFAAERVHAG